MGQRALKLKLYWFHGELAYGAKPRWVEHGGVRMGVGVEHGGVDVSSVPTGNSWAY